MNAQQKSLDFLGIQAKVLGLQRYLVMCLRESRLEICEAFGFEPPKGCDKVYTSIRKQEKKRGRPRKKVVEVNND